MKERALPGFGVRLAALRRQRGLAQVVEKMPPKLARLRKRLQKVEVLPIADQRAILKLVDALHATRLRKHSTRTTHR